MKPNYTKLTSTVTLLLLPYLASAQELPRSFFELGGTVGGALIMILLTTLGIFVYLAALSLLFSIIVTLLLLGVITTSTIIGFKERSAKKGFRLFIKLLFASIGMLAGIIVDILYVTNLDPHLWDILLGACYGIISGLIAGYFANKLISVFFNFALKKFSR